MAEPTRFAFRRWRRALGPLAHQVLAVPGNHDYGRPPDPLRKWRLSIQQKCSRRAEWFDRRAFVADFPGVVIFGLDAGPRAERVDEAQLAWLRREADRRSSEVHRVVCVHAPLFPVSAHRGSSLDAHVVARDRLYELLRDLGVILVLSGHEHVYARTKFGSERTLTQVVTGGAGARLYPVAGDAADVAFSAPHYVLVEVSAKDVCVSAVDLEGRLRDRIVLH